jgi:hypothetical protein
VRHRLSRLPRLSSLGIVLSLSIGIGACEHKPAPKQKPTAAAAANVPGAAGGAAPAAAPTAPTGANPAAAVQPAQPTPTIAPVPAGVEGGAENVAQTCMQIGVKIADVLVAGAGDAAMKAALEQARADTVRSTAEACMKGKWDAELRQCFLAAKTRAELDICSARAPGPGGNKPTRGATPPAG